MKLLSSFSIALVATLGSLYFSEIKGYIPCELCWYQRILMYPQVFLFGISIIKKDSRIRIYTFPFASLGLLLSTYHYLIQKVPVISPFTLKNCGIDISCSGNYINWFGFITIPFLSLVAFLLLCLLNLPQKTDYRQ